MKTLIFTAILLGSQWAQAISAARYLEKHGVAYDAAKTAMDYYIRNFREFENNEWVSIIDYRMNSRERRYFLVNTLTWKVYSFLVAHGKNSDINHDGYAETFSNKPQSKMTSLGFYKVSETYQGKHGLSVKLDGLSDTNSNARQRAVVIHGASYINKNSGAQGRSWGCPAVENRIAPALIKRIQGGSLLLAYYGS